MLKGLRWCAALLIVFCWPVAVRAQETVVRFDPAKTKIEFTLGATMHTVHGTFKLKSGEIRVDPATGKASGALIVDATSGDTDNSGRDHKMHSDILESAKFTEITFTPTMVTAPAGQTVRAVLESKGKGQVNVDGMFRLHGGDHETVLDLTVDNDSGGQMQVAGQFQIPYIRWGLKSPNTFILHVSDMVDVSVQSTAQVSAGR